LIFWSVILLNNLVVYCLGCFNSMNLRCSNWSYSGNLSFVNNSAWDLLDVYSGRCLAIRNYTWCRCGIYASLSCSSIECDSICLSSSGIADCSSTNLIEWVCVIHICISSSCSKPNIIGGTNSTNIVSWSCISTSNDSSSDSSINYSGWCIKILPSIVSNGIPISIAGISAE
jgi:hypothetical protein